MARSRKPTPSYLPHSQSGRARAVWTDATGTRCFMMLPGPFDSSESRTAFARLQLELETAPHRAGPVDPDGITVNELMEKYKGFAEGHYRSPDGKPTGEAEHMGVVSRHVRGVYGDTPAAAFGPLALKAVRQRFVNAGWCRKTVNQQTERDRRIYK
jgi:hypothetical protein